MRVCVATTSVFVGREVVAVGGNVLVEVGTSTGPALTGVHALRMSTTMQHEINLNWVCLGIWLTAPQDTLPA